MNYQKSHISCTYLPCWSLGALVSRMLGQKRTHEDHVDMMTLAEFFAHYPTLEAFLLTHLETGAADQQAAGRGSLRLQPTTFPVLSILARLSSGNLAHCNSRQGCKELYTYLCA